MPIYYCAKMKDLLHADAQRICETYGCELINYYDGNYMAMSEHQEYVEEARNEAAFFLKQKGNK